MISDEERCEVARRLRDMRLKPWDDTACEIASCAGIVCCNSECHGSDETPECARALCDRLADLIEPQTSKQTNPRESSLSASLCDRDALLALADEINDTSCDNHGELSVSLGDVWGWAQAIRDALGVVE